VYHSDTEIIYPMRVTPQLQNLRGDMWRKLVDRVLGAPDASLEHLAFTLLIIRLSSCLTCHTHSYRALRGCTLCAKHTIMRFRGNDSDLIKLFEYAYADINAFLRDGKVLLETLSGRSSGGSQV
jgi:hypothetical protein